MYLTYNVAEYFSAITDLQNKKILDFGCNHSNFLKFGFSGDYTGVDIDLSIIQANRITYPNSKFIHYDTHNNQYNISNKKIKFETDETYDLICAFSVFTHTCFKEYMDTVNHLRQYLNKDGQILSTFIDLNDEVNIRLMFDYRNDILSNIDLENFLKNIKKCYTVSIAVKLKDKKTDIYYNQFNIKNYNEQTYFITMYNSRWLEKNSNGKVIDVTKQFNDIRGAQKCLIVT